MEKELKNKLKEIIRTLVVVEEDTFGEGINIIGTDKAVNAIIELFTHSRPSLSDEDIESKLTKYLLFHSQTHCLTDALNSLTRVDIYELCVKWYRTHAVQTKCEVCDGHGEVSKPPYDDSWTCPNCNGSGSEPQTKPEVSEEKILEILNKNFSSNNQYCRTKNFKTIEDVVKELLHLFTHSAPLVSGSFTADDVERAYDDGYQTEGEVSFDIENYR